jgi:probable rRNA maturation factor
MPESNTRKRLSPRKPSRLVVEVANRQKRRIAPRRLVQAIELATRGWSGEVSLAVVDAKAIRRLNRKFLRHDYVTDVLSFLLVGDNRRKQLTGEIVVCADLAAATAAGKSWKWDVELLWYAVHGALHLVGYNDETTATRRRMRAAERRILTELGIQILPDELELLPKEPA